MIRELVRQRIALRREEGAAAVEFALIAVLLFTILFGIIQYGMWLSQYEVFQSAAREGARVGALRGSVAQIQTAVANAATPYSITGGQGTIGSSVDGGGTVCTDTTVGKNITVSWTQHFNGQLFPMIPAITPEDRVITGVFRCE